MSRPSRNVDALLLKAGRELFPGAGVAGLSVRKVTERAGVNLGMFHYHFRTKEAFVRALLQRLYDEMFADLEVASGGADPVAALRATLNVLARFARDQRQLLKRLVGDAMNEEPLALEFVRNNLPRHAGVVASLIAAGQQAHQLKPVPLPQAVAFVAGAVGAPIILGSAIVEHRRAPRALRRAFATTVLSDAALAQRVDLALAGLVTTDSRRAAGGARSAACDSRHAAGGPR